MYYCARDNSLLKLVKGSQTAHKTMEIVKKAASDPENCSINTYETHLGEFYRSMDTGESCASTEIITFALKGLKEYSSNDPSLKISS
jgi:hypothetical protein